MKCEGISEKTINRAKILIAEDSFSQANIMKDFLEISGHEVIIAKDGEALCKAVEMHHPDVILIDRLLPDIEGAKICRRLKQDSETSGIPIIMLSDSVSTSDRVAGLASGADDCISKPYIDEELSALICARLRVKSEWDELKQKTRHLEEMLTRVETLAHIDSLTGLCNRRRFETVLASEFKRAVRYDIPLSCLILDIDHFKTVNDTHGHLVGDEVLRETVKVIQNTIREVDMAARWGGEEFIILNPNTEKKNALIVGDKILKAVSSRTLPCINGNAITVSIGIAGIYHPEIDTAEQLVHAADLAMYDAKRNGRNRVMVAA